MDIPGDLFWQFSINLYKRPGVGEACLELQDHSGADVNLVLYLLWCAATDRPLDPDAIDAADRRIATWREEVTEPLRAVSRAMRKQLLHGLETDALREEVKAAELGAERLTQAALFASAPRPGMVTDRPTAIRDALAMYGARLKRPLADEPVAALLRALPQF